MDILQKQKLVMVFVIVVLSITSVYFMQQRMQTIERQKSTQGLPESDIHRQELNTNTPEYKILKNSQEKVYIHEKNKILDKNGNVTLFYSIYNEYQINSKFWISNVACNDGNTIFFNPKYETHDRIVVEKNETEIFPLRVYYPNNINVDSARSFNCKIHVSNGISEYDIQSFVLVLKP